MIQTYKKLLLEDALAFYCDFISDETIIAGKEWSELKETVMKSEDFESENLFSNLSSYEKLKLRSLVFA